MLSIAVLNIIIKSNLLSIYIPFTVGLREKLRQDLNLEPAGGTATEAMEESFFLVCCHGSLSLLFYTTQDHLPRVGTTHSHLGTLTSIISQEIPHKLIHRLIYLKHFLNFDSLFSDDYDFCQVRKNLGSISDMINYEYCD